MRRCSWLVLGFAIMILGSGISRSAAQSVASPSGNDHTPSPGRALLYSLLIPGLGHYYVDHRHWGRGQIHLAAEAVLWATLLELKGYSHVLNNNMYTYAAVHSGTEIRNRDRSFQLAVGDFNSLQDYNDYQARARNWGQLYPDNAKYYWKWDQQGSRQAYLDMNKRYNTIHQQIPAVIALMVANRVISGLSAYLRARDYRSKQNIEMGLAPSVISPGGVVANIRIGF